MRIHSRHDVDDADWPDDSDGAYARSVLGPFVREGVSRFVANVDAEVRVLSESGHALPLVVVDRPSTLANPSYVASPIAHYVDYARREVEIELHDRPILARVLPLAIEAFRPILRWGEVERAVYVNNWLLSTNLYPPLEQASIRRMHDGLRDAFPSHAIVFRSVNAELNGDLFDVLRGLGYEAVLSRQIYVLDPAAGEHRRKKSFQKDRGLARRSPYRWRDASTLSEADCPRLKRLYDDLYLDKYSRYNPQFTVEFFVRALRSGWLNLMALDRDGRIDGVLGFVVRAGVMTTPLVGYDRSLPAELGLYRLISHQLVVEAERRGLVLHQSSGAAKFKVHRGSKPSIEFNLAYTRHLPRRRRLPWQLLASLSEHVAVPMMRRFGL